MNVRNSPRNCCSEPNRPALSKLAGAWADLGIELILGNEVTGFDPERHEVSLRDHRTLPCNRLLIATGTKPRRLQALETGPLPVHYLRTIEDAAAIRRALDTKARVAIVGGGVIGLEAAAAAAEAGCAVTVIEAAPGLLTRALPPVASAYLKSRHEQRGVRFRLGVAPEGSDLTGVVLADGSHVEADVIVVGVGVDPETALAARLGLDVAGGIKVDALGRTALPNVFAAGDVAIQFSPWHDRWMRIETWANAQDQAASVARNMVGAETPYLNPPWFWTDQYDVNLQIVGDPITIDPILRGDPDAGRFSVIAQRGSKIVGAVVVNTPRDMAALRRLVANGIDVPRSDLENPGFDLRRALKP